jgi:hypothetical protein
VAWTGAEIWQAAIRGDPTREAAGEWWACGEKIEWRHRGETGQATKRGREAQRGPLGHGGGRGVLELGYMSLVWLNVFMNFISAGTLG